MNEEPNGFWKKPWTVMHWLRAWFILVAASLFIILIITRFVPGWLRFFSDKSPILVILVGSSLVIGTVFLCLSLIIRCFFSWRSFNRLLFGLACLATLIGLFYAEENWRGWHAWNEFKQQWEVKGEKFDFASFVPPPVPDDQNFAMSPVWVAQEKYSFLNRPKMAEVWYGDCIYNEEVSNIVSLLPITVSAIVGTNWSYHLPETPEVFGLSPLWTTTHMMDLKPWQTYYRDLERTNPAAEISITPQPQSPAQDVLLALSKFDPVIDKLRQDSALPYSRFPLEYDKDNEAAILLPHLAALKGYSQVLQLRAIAELQNGENEKALDDVKLILRLSDSTRIEPIIISQLVGFANFQIALQPIYEGLASHEWSDAQLEELDSELSKLDFLARYEFAVRGERAGQIKIVDYLEQKRSRLSQVMQMTGDNGSQNAMIDFPIAIAFYLSPKGWFYQNEIVLAQKEQENLLAADDVNQTVSPQMAARANDVAGLFSHLTPYNYFARLFVPALGAFAQRTAYAQTSANLAQVAIALERYRLMHGEYPESLDALAPQFIQKLPHDIIGGGPLHYRCTDDGLFVLYSVGWNEKDDGGRVVLRKGGAVDVYEGDWVWRYPQK